MNPSEIIKKTDRYRKDQQADGENEPLLLCGRQASE